MSEKEWRHYIADILHSVERIQKAVAAETYESFAQDEDIQDIVMRRFQIIGEAAKKIPDDKKAGFSDVPWQKVISLRNIVVHEYGYVDLKVVWDTIHKHLPELKTRLSEL
jgi:uncharacterized protein with HEPN domain